MHGQYRQGKMDQVHHLDWDQFLYLPCPVPGFNPSNVFPPCTRWTPGRERPPDLEALHQEISQLGGADLCLGGVPQPVNEPFGKLQFLVPTPALTISEKIPHPHPCMSHTNIPLPTSSLAICQMPSAAPSHYPPLTSRILFPSPS